MPAGRPCFLPLHLPVACAITLGLTAASPLLAQPLGGEALTAPEGTMPVLPITKNQGGYLFRVNGIDPSSANNPAGAASAGFRGKNQLVIYTSAFGNATHTNDSGMEATVMDGSITSVRSGNSPIPANGWVMSGHGSAAQWLQRFAQPGAEAGYESDDATGNKQVRIRFTPAVYLNRIDTALARAKQDNHALTSDTSNPSGDVSPLPSGDVSPAYKPHLAEAERCRATLAETTNNGLSASWRKNAETCEQAANRAYFNTLTVQPEEFRGTWLRPRPDDVRSGRIPATLAQMKRLGIRHIFLETYYQGKTVFPSQTMEQYGLPAQHIQYKGMDPLEVWTGAAHQEGLKVHAWVQVFFAGNKDENSEPGGPILNKYPEWRNIQRPYVAAANPVPSNVEPGHYFLDPANPDVRTYLQKLLLEIVTRYPVDGLNLDYIRYPASYPVSSGAYLSSTWGYTPIARNRFRAMLAKEAEERRLAEKVAEEAEKQRIFVETGHYPKPKPPKAVVKATASDDPKDLTPSSALWPRWMAWRKDQVSTFVGETFTQARSVRPELMVSAVVFPSSDPTYAQKLQDYSRWAREGWIQALTPIGLSPNPLLMYTQTVRLKENVAGKIPVYPGIFSLYNRETPLTMLHQIDALHRAGTGGVMLFDYSRLTPEYEDALEQGPFRGTSRE